MQRVTENSSTIEFFVVVVIVIIIIIIIMLFNISRCMEDRPIRDSTLVKIYRHLSLWELL